MKDLDFIEGSFQPGHEVGGRISQPDDVPRIIGRLQWSGTVGCPIEVESRLTIAVTIGDRDVMPAAIVDRPGSRDNAQPTDVEAQFSSTYKEGLSFWHPLSSRGGTTEDRPDRGPGFHPGGHREISSERDLARGSNGGRG